MHNVALDTNSIQRLLEDFHRATGIRVAFVSFDFKTWIEIPKEKSFFCTLLRKDSSAEHKCNACDSNAFKMAADNGSLYVYECHAGLTEAVSPIIYEEKLLGYLMLGQTLYKEPNKEIWEKYQSYYSKYKVELKTLENAFNQLTCLDYDVIYSAARIMDMSAKFIHYNKLVKLKEPQLLEKIKKFMEANLERNITTEDLGSYLGLSSSYVSHVIKSNLKLSFTEYLITRRVEKAKQLLEQSSLKINEIATQLGFQDQNYFAKIFKKHEGITASEFRNNSKK